MNRPSDDPPDWLRAARNQWRWRGRERPAFAIAPGPDQFSVWDYPRPPCLVPEVREVIVRWRGIEVARTRRAMRLLETSHPPSFYIPWLDVKQELLRPASGSSMCEWKGCARYWTLAHDDRRLERVAWSYPAPFGDMRPLSDCVAFYPRELDCTVDDARVLPQPGGFYGGWITPELTGPFKGEPGSESW